MSPDTSCHLYMLHGGMSLMAAVSMSFWCARWMDVHIARYFTQPIGGCQWCDMSKAHEHPTYMLTLYHSHPWHQMLWSACLLHHVFPSCVRAPNARDQTHAYQLSGCYVCSSLQHKKEAFLALFHSHFMWNAYIVTYDMCALTHRSCDCACTRIQSSSDPWIELINTCSSCVTIQFIISWQVCNLAVRFTDRSFVLCDHARKMHMHSLPTFMP